MRTEQEIKAKFEEIKNEDIRQDGITLDEIINKLNIKLIKLKCFAWIFGNIKDVQ
jgi:hypothetical protein